jgi:hypothetical protein
MNYHDVSEISGAIIKQVPTERELSTTRKSVISAPAWPPKPRPAVPIALGADQAPNNHKIRLKGSNSKDV